MLGGTASTPGQPLGMPTTVQPGSAATAVTQRVAPVTPTAISAVRGEALTLNAYVFVRLQSPLDVLPGCFCVLPHTFIASPL